MRRPRSSVATSARSRRRRGAARQWSGSCSPTRSWRNSAATRSRKSRVITRQPRSRSGGASRHAPRPDIVIRPILRYGAGVLHQPANPVAGITPDILQLVDDMVQTMYAAPGIGLAATQVGVPLRIFVADVSGGHNPAELLAFINPELVQVTRSP